MEILKGKKDVKKLVKKIKSENKSASTPKLKGEKAPKKRFFRKKDKT
jgi:hypothetical protein